MHYFRIHALGHDVVERILKTTDAKHPITANEIIEHPDYVATAAPWHVARDALQRLNTREKKIIKVPANAKDKSRFAYYWRTEPLEDFVPTPPEPAVYDPALQEQLDNLQANLSDSSPAPDIVYTTNVPEGVALKFTDPDVGVEVSDVPHKTEQPAEEAKGGRRIVLELGELKITIEGF